jgi:HEAT repeat protein
MTKANEKIIAYHMARLKDKNPQVRLQSIKELSELGDEDTLSILEDLYKSDPDGDVRKAAQEAGRAIFIKNSKK